GMGHERARGGRLFVHPAAAARALGRPRRPRRRRPPGLARSRPPPPGGGAAVRSAPARPPGPRRPHPRRAGRARRGGARLSRGPAGRGALRARAAPRASRGLRGGAGGARSIGAGAVRRLGTAATALALVLLAVATRSRALDDPPAPAPAAEVRIVSPASGERVLGLVTVRAEVAPALAERVTRVSLRADGEALCARERPPYECEWDAGSGESVHVLRAVAELSDGSRRVATQRTAATARAMSGQGALTVTSDVNVVQVIAIVTDARGRFVSGLGEADFHVFEDD